MCVSFDLKILVYCMHCCVLNTTCFHWPSTADLQLCRSFIFCCTVHYVYYSVHVPGAVVKAIDSCLHYLGLIPTEVCTIHYSQGCLAKIAKMLSEKSNSAIIGRSYPSIIEVDFLLRCVDKLNVNMTLIGSASVQWVTSLFGLVCG